MERPRLNPGELAIIVSNVQRLHYLSIGEQVLILDYQESDVGPVANVGCIQRDPPCTQLVPIDDFMREQVA